MPQISEILEAFEAKGQINVRLDAVAKAVPEASEGALRQALHRQELRGRLVGLSRGSDHWLIVPLQYAAAGAPPLEMWLHQYLEKTLRIFYYVGLLSAAETYGAAPYGVMVTQVAVEVPRRPLEVGRHRLAFVTRRNANVVPTQWHETPNGRFRVSTPEATALDLIRRMSIVGGIARVRDTLKGLHEHFTKEGLEAALKAGDEAATAQRLGALLQLDGRADLARVVGRWLEAKPTKFTTLSGRRRAGAFEVNESFKVWLDEAQGRSGA